MMVVVMIPAIVVIVIAVRAVMMMVMMPPTVMVMVIIAVICAGSPRMSAMGHQQTCPYSITWSARRRRAGGIWMPKDRAVAELITKLNSVGCSMGKSLG